TITGTPAFGSAGTYSIVFTVNDGTGATNATASSTTVLTITATNQTPAISAPATASGSEGAAIATITATATDADASNNLTITQSGKPASLTFTAQAAGPSPRTATITGTPGFSDAGSYTIVWTVNDGTGTTNATASTTTVLTIANTNQTPAITAPAAASDTAGTALEAIMATATNATASTTTVLTLTPCQNRAPTANPGGPYNGVVGVPVNFDGTGSTDPDGDALTYAWNFGDGGTAAGSMTSHAYADSGDFVVCLTVADRPAGDPNLLSDTKCTTAHITTELPARIFTVGGNG